MMGGGSIFKGGGGGWHHGGHHGLNKLDELKNLAVQPFPTWSQAGKSCVLHKVGQERVVFYLSNVLCGLH